MFHLEVLPRSQSFDRPFLNTVQDSFYNLWSPEAAPYLFGTLGAVLLVALLATGYNLLAARRRAEYDAPAGWVVDRLRVVAILQEALAQRAKLELRFTPVDPARKSLPCALNDVTRETLILEPPAYAEVGRHWLRREVECYFRQPDAKGQVAFYRFTSEILGVTSGGKDRTLLEVAMPEMLHDHQKRGFLRLTPPAHYFLGMALWPESRLKQASGLGEAPTDLRQWGKPLFTCAPDKERNPVTIENISAGGVRVIIRSDAVKAQRLSLHATEHVLMLLDLYDPAAQHKRRFWLRSRVRNVYEDFETRDLELGLQFVAQGKLMQEGERAIKWYEVGPDGIEPIAVWVMQRHLELYRTKGLG